MIGQDMARTNRLLAALPQEVLARWLPELEPIDLPLGAVLRETGARLPYAVFPTTALVCLVHLLEDGGSTEVAVIGFDGLVGMPVFMGGGTALSRAVVQSAGHGLRMRTDFLADEFQRQPAVMQLLLRFAQALMTQMSQTAVCNRHHALEQQLCRWLLLSLDRLPGDELVMTQELIAHMLGVRREGVTEAAGRLGRDGLIAYRRGRITVLDRAALERRACECYAVVEREYRRLLPHPTVAG